MYRIKIGCIADDFTGASDVASFMENEGIKTILYNGVPDENYNNDADGVVIALKTRTLPKEEAVRETIQALRFLQEAGTEKYYIKYCSTFDSTSEGNIGPVLDACLEELGIPYTIVCPSFPVNGRQVIEGKLYVHGQLLEESPMKDHPLTPMRESEIKKLLDAQSVYTSHTIFKDELMESNEQLKEKIHKISMTEGRFYVIPDFETEEHGERILTCFHELRLFSGASGFMKHLASYMYNRSSSNPVHKFLLLAGSCSQMTLKQIAAYEATGRKSYKLDIPKLLSGEENALNVFEQVKNMDCVLVYSSEDPLYRHEQKSTYNSLIITERIETTMAELAVLAKSEGFEGIIVAGGETSGAVTKALEIRSYEIGISISPGVPLLKPTDEEYILLLKSGNFGGESFFIDAVEMMYGEIAKTEDSFTLKMKEAIETAKSLFERGKTAGSSANISFKHRNRVYISRSGSSFGTLVPEDFAEVSLTGEVLSKVKPSKELPLHLALYRNDSQTEAVIHTHSFYSTLWSCLEHMDTSDSIPSYTPYLKMKLGAIPLVPYAKPGSKELFELFEHTLGNQKGYLLRNHGAIVAGYNMFQAFECLEELEESAKIAWHLRGLNAKRLEDTK